MKKAIILFAATAMLATTALVSCKKNQVTGTETPTTQPNQLMQTMSTSAFSVSVDTRGFLIFPSTKDVDNYAAYISSLSLAQVKAYHSGIGFTSLAGGKYAGLDQNTLVTDAQLKDFMLDANGMMQVGGTIFRPTNDNLYLLTLQATLLDEGNYDQLASEVFDEGQMNKFAVRIEREEGFNLFNVISESPYGIAEENPGGSSVIMKFWGTTNTYGPCNPPLGRIQYTNHFAFWIKTVTVDGYVPC